MSSQSKVSKDLVESVWSLLGVCWVSISPCSTISFQSSSLNGLSKWVLQKCSPKEISKLRPVWSLLGVQFAGSLLEVHWESAGSPVGVCWESAGSPLGVRWVSAGSPLGVRWESAFPVVVHTLGGIASICFNFHFQTNYQQTLRTHTQRCQGCQKIRNFVRNSKILMPGRPFTHHGVNHY
jgi:hypothetical protein